MRIGLDVPKKLTTLQIVYLYGVVVGLTGFFLAGVADVGFILATLGLLLALGSRLTSAIRKIRENEFIFTLGGLSLGVGFILGGIQVFGISRIPLFAGVFGLFFSLLHGCPSRVFYWRRTEGKSQYS